jgi:hypothetical protein
MQVVYQGVEFEVEFYADKGHPGSYWEPSEPPEFYLTSIQINNVEMIDWFTEGFITEFEKFLIELLKEPDEY